jgi:hypothetical protein
MPMPNWVEKPQKKDENTSSRKRWNLEGNIPDPVDVYQLVLNLKGFSLGRPTNFQALDDFYPVCFSFINQITLSLNDATLSNICLKNLRFDDATLKSFDFFIQTKNPSEI